MLYYGKHPMSNDNIVVYAGAYRKDDLVDLGIEPLVGGANASLNALCAEPISDPIYGFKWIKVTDKPRCVLFGCSSDKELLESEGFIGLSHRYTWTMGLGWHPFTVPVDELEMLRANPRAWDDTV